LDTPLPLIESSAKNQSDADDDDVPFSSAGGSSGRLVNEPAVRRARSNKEFICQLSGRPVPPVVRQSISIACRVISLSLRLFLQSSARRIQRVPLSSTTDEFDRDRCAKSARFHVLNRFKEIRSGNSNSSSLQWEGFVENVSFNPEAKERRNIGVDRM